MSTKQKKVWTFPKTRPYKEIVIQVHPDFVPRLQTHLVKNVSRGITSNLSPKGYLAFLFEINEYLPKKHKLTDYQIARAVVSEFPAHTNFQRFLDFSSVRKHAYYSVHGQRSYYNSGKLIKAQPVRKGPISFRYNSEGERLSFKRATKLLTEEEYQQILARYGPDLRTNEAIDFSYKMTPLPKNKGGRPCYKSFDWCI